MKPWKQETKDKAMRHYQDVSNRYKKEIEESILNTTIYSGHPRINVKPCENKSIELSALDSVSEISRTPRDTSICVLNFASHKSPGGMFLEGSVAQEESLCHESTLFPILCAFNDSYYAYNRTRTNYSLYINRALYTPGVIFERGDEKRTADVLTCAAPNFKSASKYHNVSREENNESLKDRINFMYEVCACKGVETLIAGAWGCGVFGQDPEMVCRLLIESKNRPKKLVLAIPDASSRNYQGFMKALEERSTHYN